MKKVSFIAVVLLLSHAVYSQVSRYHCPANGNAESNNFTNWTTWTGVSDVPQTNNSFVANFDAARFGVHAATGPSSNFSVNGNPMITNGVDRYGLFQIPNEGNYCFRVGNNYYASQSDLMKFTFEVTASNAIFKFRYAVVLQDGGHEAGENPSVTFYMNRGSSITPVSAADYQLFNATYRNIVADLNNPYFKRSTVQSDVIYKSWQCVEYDLTAYIGQTVSFCFRTRDCSNGQHFGYGYLDGLCTNWPAIASMSLNRETFCLQQDVIMNAAATTGEDRFYMEVTEVDQNNQPIPGGVTTSQWFDGIQAPDNFNVTDYFEGKGYHFECGKYYRIKFAVANDCAPWNMQEKVIQFVCPEINIGEDRIVCCTEGTQGDGQQIGWQGPPGSTYSWSSIPAGLNATSPFITDNAQTSTGYTLTMTTPEGCIAQDDLVVRFKPAANLIQLSVKYKICDPRPFCTVNITPYYCENTEAFDNAYPYHPEDDVQWYFVATGSVRFRHVGSGESIYAPDEEGVLYAMYNSGCSEMIMQSIPIEPTGPRTHNLIAPNSFTPDGDDYNNIFMILEYGPYAPYVGDITPAYDAIDFNLRIWNRWGNNFVTVNKATIGRAADDALMQGDIQWDGYDGQYLVQSGVYNYTLEMKYCGTEEFVQIPTPNGNWNQCIAWAWFFCTEHIGGWSSELIVQY